MNQAALIDQSAALLASCVVAKYDKIQSTQYVVDLWQELRGKLNIQTRFDYLVAILSQGRLMDLKIDKSNYLQLIQESIDIIRQELAVKLTYPIIGIKDGSEVLAKTYIVRLNDIASAMLAAAVTDLSEKVESSKEIIELWDNIREMKIVENNHEYLAALLVTSRINDLKKELQDTNGLTIIIENFRSLLTNIEPNLKISKIDIAAAYLTIAIITQTPQIESHGEIIRLWSRFKEELELNNKDRDIIASILTAGLIRNMTMKLNINYIKDIFNRIWTRLQENKYL